MTELDRRKVRQIVQDREADKWKSQDSNIGGLDPVLTLNHCAVL